VTLSQSTNPQNNSNEELIVLTKSKHDALRKDIEDYKNLLIKYQSTKIEYDVLVNDLERQSKLTSSTFDQLKKSNNRVDYLESELATIKDKLEKLAESNSDYKKSYAALEREYYKEKRKVYKLKKQQGGVYVWRGLAIFMTVAFIIIAGEKN
jgi:chromosome segregation ATPase